MLDRQKWVDRAFDSAIPPSRYPNLLERLRGTPCRLEERTVGLSVEVLTRRDGDCWSIQENAGHLLDLEPLWLRRANQLFDGVTELAAADMTNRATWEADHNARPLAGLLSAFRTVRSELLRCLARADETTLARSAMHPRLRHPMSLVDLANFVAEHDDHHLATISALRNRWSRD